MSFSGDVKKELALSTNKRRHCQLAELAAIVALGGQIVVRPFGRCIIKVQTENFFVAKKYCTLLKKTFNINADVTVRVLSQSKSTKLYTVFVTKSSECLLIMQALKLFDEKKGFCSANELVSPILIQQNCCKRAFLRGAFLVTGSMSDPKKSYHMEIVCTTADKASQLQDLMISLTLSAKTVLRKKQYVVYIKEGDQLVDALNLMDAHVSLMEFENIRILRGIANNINRTTNCEVANSQKTITASTKQQEDIMLIDKTYGLSSLPPTLYEIAIVRLENPDVSIKELGEMLSPPIGKSGVNHRLRKLNQLANEIRGI